MKRFDALKVKAVPGSAGVTHDFNDQRQLIWRPTLADRTQQGNRIKKYSRRAQPARRAESGEPGVALIPPLHPPAAISQPSGLAAKRIGILIRLP